MATDQENSQRHVQQQNLLPAKIADRQISSIPKPATGDTVSD